MYGEGLLCPRSVRTIMSRKIVPGFAINSRYFWRLRISRTTCIDINGYIGWAAQWHGPRPGWNAVTVCDLCVDIEFNCLPDNNHPECRGDVPEMWRDGPSDGQGRRGADIIDRRPCSSQTASAADKNRTTVARHRQSSVSAAASALSFCCDLSCPRPRPDDFTANAAPSHTELSRTAAPHAISETVGRIGSYGLSCSETTGTCLVIKSARTNTLDICYTLTHQKLPISPLPCFTFSQFRVLWLNSWKY